MIVCGWDPGVVYLAYGVIELSPARSRVLDHAVIGDGNTAHTYDERLDVIATNIDRVMNRWCPDAIGYEDQSGVEAARRRDGTAEVNFASHWVHDVCGMIRFAARCSLEEPVPCYRATPQSIKVALLGKGNRGADKSAIKSGVRQLFGVQKCSSHEADAIAMAVTTLRKHNLAEARRRAAAPRSARA